MDTSEKNAKTNLKVVPYTLQPNNKLLLKVFNEIAEQVESALLSEDLKLKCCVIDTIHWHMIGWAWYEASKMKPGDDIESKSEPHILAMYIWKALLESKEKFNEKYRYIKFPKSMLAPDFIWTRYLLASLANPQALMKYRGDI